MIIAPFITLALATAAFAQPSRLDTVDCQEGRTARDCARVIKPVNTPIRGAPFNLKAPSRYGAACDGPRCRAETRERTPRAALWDTEGGSDPNTTEEVEENSNAKDDESIGEFQIGGRPVAEAKASVDEEQVTESVKAEQVADVKEVDDVKEISGEFQAAEAEKVTGAEKVTEDVRAQQGEGENIAGTEQTTPTGSELDVDFSHLESITPEQAEFFDTLPEDDQEEVLQQILLGYDITRDDFVIPVKSTNPDEVSAEGGKVYADGVLFTAAEKKAIDNFTPEEKYEFIMNFISLPHQNPNEAGVQTPTTVVSTAPHQKRVIGAIFGAISVIATLLPFVPKLVPGVLKAPYVGKFFKAISFRKRDGVDAETARVDLNSMMKEKWVKYHSVSTRRLLVKRHQDFVLY